MTKFSPILRKPGEVIKSEEWNKMQEDIQADIEELERKLSELKDYVDNMEESTTDPVVAFPTPSAPPSVRIPCQDPITAMRTPKKADLISPL